MTTNLFDYNAHAATAAKLTADLATAEAELAAAEAALTEAETVLASVDVARTTPAKLNAATAAVTIADAYRAEAATAAATLRQKLHRHNTDSSLAEALVPMAKRLAVGPTRVLATPGPIDVIELGDHEAVLVLEQMEPTHRDPSGWLSSQIEPGSKAAITTLKLVHYRPAYWSPLTAELLADAAERSGVNLADFISDLQMRKVSTVVGSHAVDTWRVGVEFVMPELPLIGVQPDTGLLGRWVAGRVAEGFRTADPYFNDPSADAGSPTQQLVSVKDADDVRQYGARVEFGWSSLVGSHGEQEAIVTATATDLVGRALPTWGRCTRAALTGKGERYATGPHWGNRGAMITLDFVAQMDTEAAEAA